MEGKEVISLALLSREVRASGFEVSFFPPGNLQSQTDTFLYFHEIQIYNMPNSKVLQRDDGTSLNQDIHDVIDSIINIYVINTVV